MTTSQTLAAIRNYTSKRWILVGTKTGKIKNKGYSTRAMARRAKTAGFKIFDVATGSYIR